VNGRADEKRMGTAKAALAMTACRHSDTIIWADRLSIVANRFVSDEDWPANQARAASRSKAAFGLVVVCASAPAIAEAPATD